MSQWRAILLLIMAFGCGVIFGLILSQRTQYQNLQQSPSESQISITPRPFQNSASRPPNNAQLLGTANNPSFSRPNTEDIQPGDRRKKMLEHLNQALDLSPEQYDAIAKIMEASHQKIQKTRSQIKNIFEESENQIKSVLSEEQIEKFDKIIEFRKQHQQPMRKNNKFGPPGRPGAQGSSRVLNSDME